ncbi:MAG: Type II secretory pathway, pullulanase PulA and related glycosidase [Ruminococcus sp.]|jgi:isoamylase
MQKSRVVLSEAAGLEIRKGFPQIPGASRWEGGCSFSVSLGRDQKEASLILYRGKSGKIWKEIPLSDEFRTGRVLSLWIGGLGDDRIEYNYRIDGEITVDPWAKALTGREKFAAEKTEEDQHSVRGILPSEKEFSPSDVPSVFIPYSEMVLYKLHVRGFTSGRQSRTVKKGTFAGLKEKIPYLKELGVTSVELMPAYDFWELPEHPAPKLKGSSERERRAVSLPVPVLPGEDTEKRVNYWGYTGGYYCAPKASYCAGKDSMKEFQDCIDCFHQAGMECIMEFYFAETFPPLWIIEILRYWMMTYHIDGFHLVGPSIPADLAAKDELLCQGKIICSGFDIPGIYRGCPPERKNLAVCNGEFMGSARRFLKSDADQVAGYVWHNRHNSPFFGVINYLACQDGFTLADMVSYNEKHNEENGENNRDGSEDNNSWNCGAEGATRKPAVTALRRRQMKNAVLLLMLSQGVPMIYAGDEMCNSQGGNNNAWCQDNAVGWTDWNRNKKGEEMREFVKSAIAFRKAHPILHMDREIRDTDYKSLGSPELSYHSERAWFSAMEKESRSIGLMYCGEYAEDDTGKADDYIYVAYNMHWEEKIFALPNLPEEKKWYRIADTSEPEGSGFYEEYKEEGEEKELPVPPRTVMILVGK